MGAALLVSGHETVGALTDLPMEQSFRSGRPVVQEESVTVSINATTRLLGVLGDPVGHSLSPEMHNAALRAAGLPCVYLAFAVPPAELREAVAGLRAIGAIGVNLTIPHKEAILSMLDVIAPEAQAVGAVNTLEFRDGLLVGHNTDVAGILAALREADVRLDGASVVVMGAGGSARAVCWALRSSGARITICNRTPSRAESLAAMLGNSPGAGTVDVVEPGERSFVDALQGASLIINTTSVGMSPRSEAMPEIPLRSLAHGTMVCDLIYRPRQTRLLKEAEEAGCRTMNGVSMLVHQGAASFRIWLGVEPDTVAMRNAVETALAAGGGR